MEQELKLQQEQKISQSLIQQMQLLQMTSLELEEYINTRFLDNPVLEVTEPEVPALVTDVRICLRESAPNGIPMKENRITSCTVRMPE